MTEPMNDRFKLTIDGVEYLVELGATSNSTIEIIVNGESYQVTIDPLGEQRPSRPEPPARRESLQASEREGRGAGSSAPSVFEVRAPMPGDILDIEVQPGDAVAVGQSLCALEAMKMKSAIGAPREGVIATVEVIEGQAVQHGDLLFTLKCR